MERGRAHGRAGEKEKRFRARAFLFLAVEEHLCRVSRGGCNVRIYTTIIMARPRRG